MKGISFQIYAKDKGSLTTWNDKGKIDVSSEGPSSAHHIKSKFQTYSVCERPEKLMTCTVIWYKTPFTLHRIHIVMHDIKLNSFKTSALLDLW